MKTADPKLYLAVAALALCGCSSRNADYVKAHAAETWRQQGFEIIGYEGYNWGGPPFGGSYGGACVWYTLKRIPDNGIIYDGCLERWGNEIHAYSTKAMDAIKP